MFDFNPRRTITCPQTLMLTFKCSSQHFKPQSSAWTTSSKGKALACIDIHNDMKRRRHRAFIKGRESFVAEVGRILISDWCKGLKNRNGSNKIICPVNSLFWEKSVLVNTLTTLKTAMITNLCSYRFPACQSTTNPSSTQHDHDEKSTESPLTLILVRIPSLGGSRVRCQSDSPHRLH